MLKLLTTLAYIARVSGAVGLPTRRLTKDNPMPRNAYGQWICAFDPMQVYADRDYSCSRMSDQMFDALNTSGLDASTVRLSVSGCLDAIDSIPAGSMQGWDSRDGTERHVVPTYVQRSDSGMSPQQRRDRDERMRKIIDEVVAKLAP